MAQKDNTSKKTGVGYINPGIKDRIAKMKNYVPDIESLANAIVAGDRSALSKAITFIESTQTSYLEIGRAILRRISPMATPAYRIGITGPPGVGKSTFIESLGMLLVEKGHKVAILAIDPTSQVTQGSILGDKTRMENLGRHPLAFIRPSPAGKTLGGVAQTTHETILLCEAAGFDMVLVETVGVGQSEITVHNMVDFFLLLLQPGAGDELQGIKRGVVEMADMLLINKAEGDLLGKARESQVAYRHALHLFPAKESQQTVTVRTCAALSGDGIAPAWEAIDAHFKAILENGFLAKQRQSQAQQWVTKTVEHRLVQDFWGNERTKTEWKNLELALMEGRMSPFEVAEKLLKIRGEEFQ